MMIKLIRTGSKNLIFLVLVLVFSSCQFFNDKYVSEIKRERSIKDSTFLLKDKSPLSIDQIDVFKGLNYFSVNKDYRIKAQLERLDSTAIIKLKTSTDRLPDYRIFGYIHFKIDGDPYKLTAYQNMDHQKDTIYNNLLFIPFTDNNSTITTYGGGRYIDVEMPEGDQLILDFNKSYNPYCAYNHKWSCVIPPRENALKIAINAGEKSYTDSH